MPDLLIELFSEEIPARMQGKAADDLGKLVTGGLVEAGLTYAGAAAFSTPRRLTLAVEGMVASSPTLREERRGPKVDAPEQAVEGFLRGAGVTREDLEIRDDKKGQVYFATITRPGRPAAEIVAEVLESTIRSFPWPKSMRWGNGSLRWVRPLHSILCLITDAAGEATVVPMEIDGLTAGDTTEGHRFMAPGRFRVTSFEDYAARLKRAHVVLDAEQRAQAIWQEATNLAFSAGLEVVEDKGLLREVAGLVEWPVPLMGEIGAAFLDLPPEVLKTSMKEHQKFFSVKNPRSGRIERFITVANRETADHGATILTGYQKVLSARLADAKFFWENDLREAEAGGQAWLDALSNVTFHGQLGSQSERIDRIAALAREIAPLVGADEAVAERAARWAKADLSSEMVYEFPELQGLMGRYYAEKAGLDEDVGWAAEEHYSPLGPSDDVPTRPVSVAVALADKIDTLTGFWAIDEKPTGSKDPFALRRAALGVIRLVVENGVHVNLLSRLGWGTSLNRFQLMINEAFANEDVQTADELKRRGVEETFEKGKFDDVDLDLLTFLHDRLKVYLRDQGIRHDIVDACIGSSESDDLLRIVRSAPHLSDFLKTEDGGNLLQGFKRANNILSQAEQKDGVEYSYGADVKFAETDEERALFAALDAGEPKIEAALKAEDFAAAMGAMADLRAPVDAFFEAVQVNTDNDIVRRNRLNLLSRIRKLCSSVADLSRVEG